MTFTVYGIRIRGETEARYIGQTGETPQVRLARSLWAARKYGGQNMGGFGRWLVDNAAEIEAFPIVVVSTRAEARKREGEVIQVCIALGHRLFNAQHVPASHRVNDRYFWRRKREIQAAA